MKYLPLLFLLACSSDGSPNPNVGEVLNTNWGTLRVVRYSLSFDSQKALDEIAKGMIRANRQRSGVERGRPLEGVTIEVRTVAQLPDRYGEFQYPSTIRMRVGVEEVLQHEIFHRLCSRIHDPWSDCCQLSDHRPGYDLNCEEL